MRKILIIALFAAFLSEAGIPVAVQADSNPNDPLFKDQWGLFRIKAPEAWSRASADKKVVIAILDTGIDYRHEDLAGNIWENKKEIPENKIDDDNNGFIDDVRGWDFVNGDNDPTDDNGHGTHLAGVIGATANNRKGIAGLAPNAQIMPIKVLDSKSQGPLETAALGIRYAVDNGARIINISWSSRAGRDKKLDEALEYAYKNDVVIIASAGNNGGNVDEYLPANNEFAIVVAATGTGDDHSAFSNAGNAVAVAAPGEQIRATVPGNKYESFKGTSLSAAYVSGAAGILLGSDYKLKPDEIRLILQNSTDDLGEPGWDKKFGAGRLNVDKAFRYLESGQYSSDLAALGKIINNRSNINYFAAGEKTAEAAGKKNSSGKKGSSKKKKKKSKKSKRAIANSAAKVDRGQVLIQSGKKFSKNSPVALYFSRPGGGFYPPKVLQSDGSGNFALAYKVFKPAGTYSWYAVDIKTGKASKAASYQVN